MTESDALQPAPATATTGDDLDVIVIGGGQAGLAIGYFLAVQGRKFAIVEAAREPAAAWRARWDSLKLFTSVRYSSLPGLPFPGEPDSYPGRDDVASYLIEYARRFSLPVVYVFWVLGVLTLYPVCKYYAGVKRRRSDWWLGYL